MIPTILAERTMKEIADAYARAPVLANDAKPAWRQLAEWSVRIADVLRDEFIVIEVNVASPYVTPADMFRDLDRGRIRVSTINGEHPLWTNHENIAFRLVHDIMGHYQAHLADQLADFSWQGEVNAAIWHEGILPFRDVRRALFTEVIGQAAFALDRGYFGTQKVAFL